MRRHGNGIILILVKKSAQSLANCLDCALGWNNKIETNLCDTTTEFRVDEKGNEIEGLDVEGILYKVSLALND